MGRILVGLGWGLYKGEDAGMVTAYGKGRINDLDMYIIHVIGRATWLPCQGPVLLGQR